MSTNEEGTVFYDDDCMIWEIGSLSKLPQNDGCCIWSPVFIYNLPKISSKTNETIEKISFVIVNNFDPINYIRFGVANCKKRFISYCDGYWTEPRFGGLQFEATDFSEDILEKHFEYYYLHKVRLRFFCEAISTQVFQRVNACHENGKTCELNRKEERREENDLQCSSDKPDEVECQEIKNLRKLRENFTELYVGGKHADFTIKVKNREFKVHKAIMAARSSVFDAMFSHDFSEKKSGFVPIEDCEPPVFEEFLFFVYGGKTQHLSSDNACELYCVADKYDVQELKDECISFLKQCMSTETICDIICLATKHKEMELLDLAINFLAKNMENVLVTVKWQLFLKENPIEANEIYIKALKIGFTKKNF